MNENLKIFKNSKQIKIINTVIEPAVISSSNINDKNPTKIEETDHAGDHDSLFKEKTKICTKKKNWE